MAAGKATQRGGETPSIVHDFRRLNGRLSCYHLRKPFLGICNQKVDHQPSIPQDVFQYLQTICILNVLKNKRFVGGLVDNVEVRKVRPDPFNEVGWVDSSHDHLAPGIELEKNKRPMLIEDFQRAL